MENVKKESEVSTEDILKLTEMYKQMTPANRFFMVSASGLLLASQTNSGSDDREKALRTG